MRLGISSYTYTWAIGVPRYLPEKPLNAQDLLHKAASQGICCVQIADNLPLHQLTRDQLDQLGATAKQLGVAIEVGMRGVVPKLVEIYLNIAAQLQSPILRVVVDAPEYHPDVDTIVNIITDFLPELKKRNIKLAIENHDRFTAHTFAGIVERVGSEQVGICLDSVNSMGAGEGIQTVVDILGPLTINLHLKDFSVRRVSHMMGFVVEGTPAGKGMLAVEKLVENISRYERCASAILELWTPPEPDLVATIEKEAQWAQESIAYLRRILYD